MAAASRGQALAAVLCACLLLAGGAVSGGRVDVEDMLMMERFRAWQAVYNRSYVTAAERLRRFEVYRRNMELIEATNRLGLSYKLGETPFTDLTSEEFLATHTMPPLPLRRDAARQLITTRAGPVSEGGRYWNDTAGVDVPESVDWRTKGAVTPVKSQGTCRTCWAFATVATIEGLNKIKTGKLVSLSEQEIVDCASPPGADCQTGGFPLDAMDWVGDSGGLTTESAYPYENREGICRLDKARNVVKIRGGEMVEPNNEAALEVAVARQPVAVCINSKNLLQHYKSGVFHAPNCDPEGIDHAVTVVGYGADHDGSKYWIIKNSWGDWWGDKGYFRMQRRIQDKRGMCGIAVEPSYPVM